MRKRFAFNTALAIQTAWDQLWAANLKRRAEDSRFEKKHGKRPYGANGSYYITATELERAVRDFAGQTAQGLPWDDNKPTCARIRIPGRLLSTVRDWLRHNSRLTSHNFGKGHISGARYRPVGAPLAPGEQETTAKKAERRANPRPKPRHYSERVHGTAACVVAARRGRPVWGRSRSSARTTNKKPEVTCTRCLNLLKTTAATAAAPEFRAEAVS